MKIYGNLSLLGEGEIQNVIFKELLETQRMWYKITDQKNIEKLGADFKMTLELTRQESLTPRSTIDVAMLLQAMSDDTPQAVANIVANPIGEWIYENPDKSIIYVEAY